MEKGERRDRGRSLGRKARCDRAGSHRKGGEEPLKLDRGVSVLPGRIRRWGVKGRAVVRSGSADQPFYVFSGSEPWRSSRVSSSHRPMRSGRDAPQRPGPKLRSHAGSMGKDRTPLRGSNGRGPEGPHLRRVKRHGRGPRGRGSQRLSQPGDGEDPRGTPRRAGSKGSVPRCG